MLFVFFVYRHCLFLQGNYLSRQFLVKCNFLFYIRVKLRLCREGTIDSFRLLSAGSGQRFLLMGKQRSKRRGNRAGVEKEWSRSENGVEQEWKRSGAETQREQKRKGTGIEHEQSRNGAGAKQAGAGTEQNKWRGSRNGTKQMEGEQERNKVNGGGAGTEQNK